ncbi:MAG TPA: protein kinase [Clostridia bacterium]|nr:protein kinase [Clostridia bacterium]
MKEVVSAIERYQPLWGFWRVEELIGQGGGCEVYRAYKEEWGKRYISTVKLMSFSIGKSDIKEAQDIGIDEASMPEYFKSMVGSILNEIELMYKLRGNSNIVIYEDHAIYQKKGELGWDVLIRMEFLQPLPDFLISRELGKSEVAKLGIDICKALEACGREGIIHRDIKDSSIYVSTKGEFKLGGFSLAKELLKGGRTALAQFNPLYMAPELYKEQSYDSSVDIYSLGIVMYKLLNRGRLPFLPLPPDNITVDDTEKSIAGRMAGEELPLPVDAGENLGAIILKACSYDKKDRYKSPNELRQKLERFLKADARSAKGDGLAINSTAECAAGKADYEEAQIAVDKGGADARAAYAQELEKIAVVELVASIDKMNNAKKRARKRFIVSVATGIIAMTLAFTLAFINAYEFKPPIKETATDIIKITPLPTTTTTTTPALAPQPVMGKSGEEYFKMGLGYMKSKQYGLALSAFEESKRLGYESGKVDSQIKTVRNYLKVQKLYKEATDYYVRNDYERAITAFAELAKIDAGYSSSAQYADSFFQLAGKHNLLGVQYFNEGKLEQGENEFDKALNKLESMKACISNYDQEQYSKLKTAYLGNKNRILEKAEKVYECFKLADECNKTGVNYFSQGKYDKAKLEFEKAVKYMDEIRLLVPKYSANGYDGLVQIYEGNLRRTE